MNNIENQERTFSLLSLLGSLSSVLLSLFLFVVGNFFFTSLVSITLQKAAYSSQIIGIIQSCYFAGMLIGALMSEKTVFRIGHIRSFNAGAALLVFSMLAMSFWVHPLYWAIMRFAAGFSLAVLFIVIESWLLDNADNTNRGAVLSIYMTFYYFSQAVSQFLYVFFKYINLDPFAAGAAFCTLSIIPLSLTFTSAPQITELVPMSLRSLMKRSPFGVASCVLGGSILGMLYSYVPITGIKYGYDGAIMTSIIIIGGSILQYPIGKLSDLYERRYVLFYVSLATAINAILVYFSFAIAPLLYFLLFTLGGLSFTLYPLGVSQSCDHINPKNFMQAASALLIAYGVGASCGPYLGSLTISYFSYEFIFPTIAICALALVAIGLASLKYVDVVEPDDQTSFLVAATTGPLAAAELQSPVMFDEMQSQNDDGQCVSSNALEPVADIGTEDATDVSTDLEEQTQQTTEERSDSHLAADSQALEETNEKPIE